MSRTDISTVNLDPVLCQEFVNQTHSLRILPCKLDISNLDNSRLNSSVVAMCTFCVGGGVAST